MSLRFEWDREKAVSNLQKHGVSFDEASTVFRDPLARIFDDEDHSEYERREIVIGYSMSGRLLVVAFIERFGPTVRIISARSATKMERVDHEENANV